MAGIIPSALSAARLLARSKNGIKVFEQLGKNGERVLTSYKPGETNWFKQIFIKKSYSRDAYQTSGMLFRRDVEQTNAIVNQVGKKSTNIDISTDHWFYNNKPLKSYTSGLVVQQGKQDISWIKNVYKADQCHPSGISLFRGSELIESRYF